MAYNTRYELETFNNLEHINHKDYIESFVNCNIFDGDCSWYQNEIDMRAYSRDYPDVLFKLMGYGEEVDDIWVKYFRNGKMQSGNGVIVFDEFNEELLK